MTSTREFIDKEVEMLRQNLDLRIKDVHHCVEQDLCNRRNVEALVSNVRSIERIALMIETYTSVYKNISE